LKKLDSGFRRNDEFGGISAFYKFIKALLKHYTRGKGGSIEGEFLLIFLWAIVMQKIGWSRRTDGPVIIINRPVILAFFPIG
jgi:hypothetical protein